MININQDETVLIIRPLCPANFVGKLYVVLK